MTNHSPSLQNQFMVALLAFTTLAYANVWFIKLETRGMSQEPPVESAAPDLSSMSREEMGEYLVEQVKQSLENPPNYLAVAAQSYDSAAAPVPKTPPASPQPISQCNIPIRVGQYPGTLFDLASPKLEIPSTLPNSPISLGEFYVSLHDLSGLGGQERLAIASLGSSGLDSRRGIIALLLAPPGSVINAVASGNKIAYQEGAAAGPVLKVRSTGGNNLFGDSDDITYAVFSSAPGIRLSYPFEIQRDRIVFMVAVGNEWPFTTYILEVRFGPDYVPGGGDDIVSVPSLSNAMPPNIEGYGIISLEAGINNSIMLEFGALGVTEGDILWLMNAGLDGRWVTGDDRSAHIAGGAGTNLYDESLSEDNRFVAFVQSPAGGQQETLSVFDTVDYLLNGNEQIAVVSLSNAHAMPRRLEIDGFSQSGGSRPSSGALTYIDFDTNAHAIHFVESGNDGSFGTADDIQRVIPRSMATPADFLQLADRISVWEVGRRGSPELYAAKWCY